jgi:hypothetical protein
LPDVGQGMMSGKGRYNSCVTRMMLDCGGLVVHASRVLLRVEKAVRCVFSKHRAPKTHKHTDTHKSQLEAFPFKGAAPTTRWQAGPASALVRRPDRHRERFIIDSPLIT